jgi:hypothetical protein
MVVLLIVSELQILRSYFDRNWPLLGQDSGFVTLSVAMVLLGVSILGDLNKPTTSQENLGLAFWRIVVSAGILAIIMGAVNLASVRLLWPFVSPNTNSCSDFRLR